MTVTDLYDPPEDFDGQGYDDQEYDLAGSHGPFKFWYQRSPDAHRLTATNQDNGVVGYFHWGTGDGRILGVHVHPSVQRRGLATKMYDLGRELSASSDMSSPVHSQGKTPEGESWARSVDQRQAAAKPAAKPKPPRKPEERWYDTHKHPEGVPGGMGLSPEHHLRGRGWSGHEINEGSGKKTIQYRNQGHPDFVISYGGGTSTKPDHNFRVLYMGTNTNIPKVTRSYSVAEAMNKVEELHGLHNGLVVQPMTHAASGPLGYAYAEEGPAGLTCPACGSEDLYSRGFRMKQEEPDLGCNGCSEHLHSPQGYEVVSDDGWERGGDASGMTHGAAQAPPSQQKQPIMPGIPKPAKPRDMTDADAYPQFPAQPEKGRAWWNPERDDLREIVAPPKVKPPKTVAASALLQRASGDTWEEV